MIDKHELEMFIKRILTNGTTEKAKYSLEQLKSIIIMQALSVKEDNNAETGELVELLRAVIENTAEFQDVAKESKDNEMPLTKEDIRIAMRRVEDRKRREAEMATRGRF
jgi:copper homeostasis protein CutC